MTNYNDSHLKFTIPICWFLEYMEKPSSTMLETFIYKINNTNNNNNELLSSLTKHDKIILNQVYKYNILFT